MESRYRHLASLTLLGLAFSVVSCDQVGSLQQGRDARFEELASRFQSRSGVSREVLTYSDTEYEALFSREVARIPRLRGLDGTTYVPVSLDDLDQIYLEATADLPNLDNPSQSDLSVIAQDFEGATSAEIEANLDDVRAVYYAAVRHEVFQQGLLRLNRAQTCRTGTYAVPTYPDNCLNPQEYGLLIQFGEMISGTRKATNEALAYSSQYGKSADGHQGNSLQHSIWNYLIAFHTSAPNTSFLLGGHRSTSSAVKWSKKFTDAHENGAPAPSDSRHTAMDFHNNREGRNYFESVCKFKDSKISCSPDGGVYKAFKGRTDRAVKFSKTRDLDRLTGKLVYFN